MSKTFKDRKEWFTDEDFEVKEPKKKTRKKLRPKDVQDLLDNEDFIFGL